MQFNREVVFWVHPHSKALIFKLPLHSISKIVLSFFHSSNFVFNSFRFEFENFLWFRYSNVIAVAVFFSSNVNIWMKSSTTPLYEIFVILQFKILPVSLNSRKIIRNYISESEKGRETKRKPEVNKTTDALNYCELIIFFIRTQLWFAIWIIV